MSPKIYEVRFREIQRLAGRLAERKPDLARAGAEDAGFPVRITSTEVDLAVDYLRTMDREVPWVQGSTPYGTVAGIFPYDAPAVMLARLTLPLPPSAIRLYRAVGRGRSIKYRESREWIARARSIVSESVGNLEPLTGPCTASITLYLQRRRDVNNSAKPILDVLQGLVYVNDSQVRRWLICREQVEPGASGWSWPHVVVKIEEE